MLVLLGGPFAGYRPVAELMLRLGVADALIAGDGDRVAAAAIRALLAGHMPHEVPGTIFLEDGRFRASPAAPPPNLDALPWPEFERQRHGPVHPHPGQPRVWTLLRLLLRKRHLGEARLPATHHLQASSRRWNRALESTGSTTFTSTTIYSTAIAGG